MKTITLTNNQHKNLKSILEAVKLEAADRLWRAQQTVRPLEDAISGKPTVDEEREAQTVIDVADLLNVHVVETP